MNLQQFVFLLLLALAVSCNKQSSEYKRLQVMYSQSPDKWVKPNVEDTIAWTELGMLPKPNYPEGKPHSKALIELGKQLFFDPRLSQSKQIACVSCHHPDQNWTDNRRLSLGHNLQEGTRNAPTIQNLSYSKHFFWDGRASSLEEQLLGPLTSKVEMNTSLDTVVARVKAIKGYRQQFDSILNVKNIKIKDIAFAIATFERSVVCRLSRFDKFLMGKQSLTYEELKGLHLFRTKARCINCHNGALFTDNKFHNVGLTYYGRKYEDLGRYEATRNPADVGRFKTPSLRDVVYSKPLMHNGLFNSIDGVIAMYNAGMPQPKPKKGQENDSLFPKTSPILKKLNLTKEEREYLKAFLYAISTSPYRVSKPKLP